MNNQENKWSSTDDFKKGDIITDGIILGKSNLPELRKRGLKIETEDMTGKNHLYFVQICDNDTVYAFISRLTHNSLELWPFDKKAILHLYNYVFSIGVSLEIWNSCPLLSAIGIEPQNEDEEFDFDEISDLLVEKGYIRIDNLQYEDSERYLEFVHIEPNSNGDYVFVSLDVEQENISFSVNLATECKSFITGEIIQL